MLILGLVAGWVGCYVLVARPAIKTLKQVTRTSLDIIAEHDRKWNSREPV